MIKWVTGKLSPVNFFPRKIAPKNISPCVKVRSWFRVRVGGSLPGRQSSRANFPSTDQMICRKWSPINQLLSFFSCLCLGNLLEDYLDIQVYTLLEQQNQNN